ncbi:hypothetical protein A2V71_01540, partial [Candidatus Berkelbacteria bacterium RBG_13_40_8]
FICIDEILEIKPQNREATCVKIYLGVGCLDLSDHFPAPAEQIMPGVVLLEGMNQTLQVIGSEIPELKGKKPFFAGVDKARFRHPVKPGAEVIYFGKITKLSSHVGVGQVIAKVGDKIVAEAEILFAF